MKKSVAFLSLACACAFAAYADNAQWQNTYFNGIGASPQLTDMGASNGTWTFPTGNAGVSIDSNKLVLDLDAADSVSFSILTNGEASTAHTIYAKAVFTPVKPTDLIKGADMNTQNAQIGFAVVKTDTSTYKYYAWVGGTGGASAQDDWSELAACSNPDNETDLKIEIAYWDSTAVKAKFYVKGDSAYAPIGNELTVTSTAKSAGKVASLACTGSGTIASISGDYQVGVASIGTQKYPTATAAMTAASSGDTVTINCDLTSDTVQAAGTVEAKDGVTIVNNGHQANIDTSKLSSGSKIEVEAPAKQFTTSGGTSGIYTIPCGVDDVSKLQVKLPDEVADYKQVKPGSFVQGTGNVVSFVVETKDELLPCLAESRSMMRIMLDSLAGSDSTKAKVANYLSANPTTAGMTAELNVKQTGANENGLTLMMDFALGINPTDSIAAVSSPSTDTDTENITLNIPAIGKAAWAGQSDYKIRYYYRQGETDTLCGDGTKPIIPLASGSGSYKIIVKAEVAAE